MFINKSKIQFEIYSQLGIVGSNWVVKCLSINQRYNLKSIHNWFQLVKPNCLSVYQ